MGMNNTPASDRIHIGFFGRRNAGKSSVLNAVTGQDLAVVSDVKGTTTDPVYKAMELLPLGPVMMIDTPGIDDEGQLGSLRVRKSYQVLNKTDVAVLVMDACHGPAPEDYTLLKKIGEKQIPCVIVCNKMDLEQEDPGQVDWKQSLPLVKVSALTGQGIADLKECLAALGKIQENSRRIVGDLLEPQDFAVLVVPIDKAAPKGRLILPQVQTLRELLDKRCLIMSVTTDRYPAALQTLSRPPKLIITDSQVFPYIYENKPKESMLTSFSVLFAAYKGDLSYYIEGAKAIDSLKETSHVLIAECCTHAPLKEDIGRVKIPRMLKKRFGENLQVELVSGTDFPDDLTEYDLIIQCGACMFNRKYVMYRIDRAKKQQVPVTNYGITIAHLTGILDHVALPE